MPSDPGLSIDMTYYSAGASAGRSASFARGGRIEVGLDTASNYILLTPTWTFEPKVLGGQASFGVTALWGNYASTVSATLVAPSGRSVSGALGNSMTAFGDLFPTATLKWNSGVNNFMTYLTANVPIGAYDVNRQATVGMGRWAIDGGLGYTYFHEDKGLEFSAVAGLTYNFMNPYTAYQSGIDLHVEVSASKYLTERFLAGAAGYFYQQITADSGPGADAGAVHLAGRRRGAAARLRFRSGPPLGVAQRPRLLRVRRPEPAAGLDRLAHFRGLAGRARPEGPP